MRTISRSWTGRVAGEGFTFRAQAADRDDQIAAVNILGGLLAAISLAGALALTGSLLTAVLAAAALYALVSIATLHWSYCVTARRLSESRAAYRLIADNANDLITRHDRDGSITFASPASSSLLGVTPGTLMRMD